MQLRHTSDQYMTLRHLPAIRSTARSAGSSCRMLKGLSFAHSFRLPSSSNSMIPAAQASYTSYTMLEGCAASPRFAQRVVVVRWQRPFALLLLLRQHNARLCVDIVYTTTARTPVPNCWSIQHVRCHARASSAENTFHVFIIFSSHRLPFSLSLTLRAHSKHASFEAPNARKTTISPERVCLPPSLFFYAFHSCNETWQNDCVWKTERLRNNRLSKPRFIYF